MRKFYMATANLHSDVLPHVVSDDWTPTLHFYGTVTLRHNDFTAELTGETAERFGLVEHDEDAAADEAEAGALYRSEMRHAA